MTMKCTRFHQKCLQLFFFSATTADATIVQLLLRHSAPADAPDIYSVKSPVNAAIKVRCNVTFFQPTAPCIDTKKACTAPSFVIFHASLCHKCFQLYSCDAER